MENVVTEQNCFVHYLEEEENTPHFNSNYISNKAKAISAKLFDLNLKIRL